MKKVFALLLALVMVFALAACGGEKKAEEDINAKSEGVMTYAEYAAANTDDEVVVEAYLQAKQEYNDEYGNTNLYLQDADGAYFVYHIALTPEEHAALTVGQKLKVTGYKGEWAGEVEITDAKIETLEGSYIAQPVDATELWGTDDLISRQNQLVAFKGVTVEAYDEAGAAFAYQDPDAKAGDLYFKVILGETRYEFCVESSLCGSDSEVYKTVEGLKVGDVIDLEGFLYWYEGPNLHTTAITVK